MGLVIAYAPGATPLDPDELGGLIPNTVSTHGQLNAFEAGNIEAALEWLDRARRQPILDDVFLRELHRRMFDRTWRWAGKYRRSEKNIGIAPERISVAVRELAENYRAQIEAKVAPADEIAARFHHHLVWIHAFPNGNGRHARMATDLLLERLGVPRFTWGAGDLVSDGGVRSAYISALRAADNNQFDPLFRFVRS